MIKFFPLLFCLLLTSISLSQNSIQTSASTGVENLVKNVFLKGNCKNVNNINFIGDEELSIGQFSNGLAAIKLEEGIIISTGDINLAEGPNISIEAGLGLNESSETDPDLSQIGDASLFDVRGIEFDFIPLDNHVEFRYVFASEEYCEYVGSEFNDVFGFFVSGPGINGSYSNNAINVAKLTGTDIDVSINNVNHIFNPNFYIRNELAHDALACDLDFNPEFHEFIEYDGFTIPLTATIPVIPCETYRIRLVISDVSDPILDSAVFLEAKSFDLGEKATFYADVPDSTEPIAYESCADGRYVFTRNETTNLNESCTINFTIKPESEAINGVDFEEIPLSITIPEGEVQAILPITLIEDNITEGPERLILEYVYDCDCFNPIESELIISEIVDFKVDLEDQQTCVDQPLILFPEITGGVEPYEILWHTNETSDSIEVNLNQSAPISITITDRCGETQFAEAMIEIQNTPMASLMGNFDLCEIQELGLPVQLEGFAPWTIHYSIDGIEQSPIENIETSPTFLQVTTEGVYELTSFNDANCEGTVLGSSTISNIAFQVEAIVRPPSCIHISDGSIEITEIDASNPYVMSWNIETEDILILENLNEGVYTLLIEDADGCLYEESFDLFASAKDISECAPLFVPNVFTPNEVDGNDLFSIYIGDNSGIESVVSMLIYDRWGSLIYERNNFMPDNGTTGWDGRFHGQELGSGVFVYKIEISYIDGSKNVIAGNISLIR